MTVDVEERAMRGLGLKATSLIVALGVGGCAGGGGLELEGPAAQQILRRIEQSRGSDVEARLVYTRAAS